LTWSPQIPVAVYEKYGSTILSSVEFWSATTFYWVADAESFKAVTSAANTFQKEIEAVNSHLVILAVPETYISSTKP
jgi:hypothetical protein